MKTADNKVDISKVEILRVTEGASDAFVEDISDIFKSAGKISYSPSLVRAYLELEMLMVAMSGGALLGVLSLGEWRPSDTYTWNKKYLPANRQIATEPAVELRDLVVLPQYRRQGIGRLTVSTTLSTCHICDEPVPRAYTMSRVPLDGSASSLGLLTACGFKELVRIPRFYAGSPDFKCPTCKGECSCDGVFMVWHRHDKR